MIGGAMMHVAAPMQPQPVWPGQPPQSLQDTSFPAWQSSQLHKHLRDLQEKLLLLKAVKDEVEVVLCLEEGLGPVDALSPLELPPGDDLSALDLKSRRPGAGDQQFDLDVGGRKLDHGIEHVRDDTGIEDGSSDGLEKTSHLAVLRTAMVDAGKNASSSTGLLRRKISVIQAARILSHDVKSLLIPFQEGPNNNTGGVEKAGLLATLIKKRLKVKRNRRWRSKRRQRVAVALEKEKTDFDQADSRADAWRAREIAKDLAKRKMEKMKEIAQKKAKEDRARKQEMGLLVEKLKELRALRIQKLKKQGKFFPEEDDEFMERIRSAVEEEERQIAAAADTSATATAIANASVAAQSAPSGVAEAPNGRGLEGPGQAEEDGRRIEESGALTSERNLRANGPLKQGLGPDGKHLSSQYFGDLPPEFYHYYYSSSFDMESLIEVRRSWDAFIMPGGSRIPGHWVQAPLPADPVWASYLVTSVAQQTDVPRSEDGQSSKKKLRV